MKNFFKVVILILSLGFFSFTTTEQKTEKQTLEHLVYLESITNLVDVFLIEETKTSCEILETVVFSNINLLDTINYRDFLFLESYKTATYYSLDPGLFIKKLDNKNTTHSKEKKENFYLKNRGLFIKRTSPKISISKHWCTKKNYKKFIQPFYI